MRRHGALLTSAAPAPEQAWSRRRPATARRRAGPVVRRRQALGSAAAADRAGPRTPPPRPPPATNGHARHAGTELHGGVPAIGVQRPRAGASAVAAISRALRRTICTRAKPWYSSSAEPVDQPHAVGHRLDAAEPDRVAQRAGVAHAQLQVLLADQALLDDLDLVAEPRRLEGLAPDLRVEQPHGVGVEPARIERSVGGQHAFAAARRRAHSAATCCSARVKAGKSGSSIVQPAAIAWPPKRNSSAGMALGDEVERIAQMEAGDRAARALQQRRRRRARTRRSAGAGGPSARAATMPTTPSWNAGSKIDERRRNVVAGLLALLEQRLGLLVHARLDVAPLAVDRVERLASSARAPRLVGEQALDAERHVGEAAGGVEARPDREAEVGGAARAGRARRPRTAPPRPAACGRRARASSPARRGGGCWRRA